MTAYDLFYLAMAPIATPVLAWRALTKGKYRESLPAMFGRGWEKLGWEVWQNGSVWVHAVSYGEVMAARALLAPLRQEFANKPIILTTVTETGQSLARSLVPALASRACYYPADFSWVVRRFVARVCPRLFVIMETELWPNAIAIAADSGAKIVLANGRISEKSYPAYLRIRRFIAKPLQRVSAFCMQTDADAERIAAIVGDRARVYVTGNCKFDVPPKRMDPARRHELFALCRWSPADPILVVGSTHPGEEEIALQALAQIRTEFPTARLLLVPRHPERFESVWQLLLKSGRTCHRLSQLPSHTDSPPDVVLVDKMGLLAELYGLATVAVVGGSFVPGIGGHNLLEAAAHSVPVVYGPFMDKQPEMVSTLTAENGGLQTPPNQLGDVLLELLRNPSRCEELGKRANEVVMRQQGATARTMEIIRQVMQEA